jgi:transcriptional regulator with XRE-family HTH domain
VNNVVKGNTILKALRAQRGDTLKDMANVTGLKSHAAYAAKEDGLREFKQGEMEAIAKHFGRSVEEIFFADEVCITRH